MHNVAHTASSVIIAILPQEPTQERQFVANIDYGVIETDRDRSSAWHFPSRSLAETRLATVLNLLGPDSRRIHFEAVGGYS